MGGNQMATFARSSGRSALIGIGLALLAITGCSGGGDNPPPPPAQYKIGGAVSGLSGSGLQLRSSLGDTLTVTANGAFAFATTATQGTSYQVTVAQQPTSPSQTCTVTNGAGTMGAADVTNVNVACATNTYAVGGTVTGLAAGRTLVLQNNAGDDETITADGSYAFGTAVASGAAYAVTVSTQPAGQTCTVANANGTIAAAAVANVDVTCVSDAFLVGGAVTGLRAGATLVLRNNGGDDETIDANGSYAFATPVANGSAYAVTIAAQPAGQTCAVSNGTGTMGASAVTIAGSIRPARGATCASPPRGPEGLLQIGDAALDERERSLELRALAAIRIGDVEPSPPPDPVHAPACAREHRLDRALLVGVHHQDEL